MTVADRVKRYDYSDMLSLLVGFPRQVREAEALGESFRLPPEYVDVDNVIFAGMGGSAAGSDVVVACGDRTARVPMRVVRDYHLPAYAGERTLLCVISYSGNTEETLQAFSEGVERNCKIAVVTSGGRLSELATEKGVPLLRIPGGMPPRTAIGYTGIPLLVALANLGLFEGQEQDILEAVTLLQEKVTLFGPEKPLESNLALALAHRMLGKVPLLYASGRLLGQVASRWKNQLAENGKMLAFVGELPEMNHNEIMGWEGHTHDGMPLLVVFFKNAREEPRMEARLSLTHDIIAATGVETVEVGSEPETSGRLARLLSLIYMGDWVSYYVALLKGADPTPVETITRLKERMERWGGGEKRLDRTAARP